MFNNISFPGAVLGARNWKPGKVQSPASRVSWTPDVLQLLCLLWEAVSVLLQGSERPAKQQLQNDAANSTREVSTESPDQDRQAGGPEQDQQGTANFLRKRQGGTARVGGTSGARDTMCHGWSK